MYSAGVVAHPRELAARIVAASVVALAASASIPATVPGAQVPLFRTGIDLVNVSATVVDRKGNLVTALTADDFELYEDGRKQAIRFFAAGDPVGPDHPGPPLHLGVLLDVSESMDEDIGFTKTAAIKFLNRLLDAVDIVVMDFDTEVRAARYSQNEFAHVVERIRQKKARGFTALYDAIGVYLDGAAAQDGRKVMLLYTDGGDTRSAMGYSELIDLLKASDVTVYAIGALEHQPSSTKNDQRMKLQQIAEVTGGQAFFPNSVKDLDAVYDKVVAEVRAQYTLGYQSSNEKTDGTWRRIEIRLVRAPGRDVRVRARKGYFAPFKK